MSNSLYLYGLLPAPNPQTLELKGLDQQSVCCHQIDQFVFLYSQAQQQNYLASRKNLLGHEKVLEQAMAAGYRTLLPLRFGMTIQSWDTIEEQLIKPHSNSLQCLFNHLDGRREVGIKVFWTQAEELNALMQQDQNLKAKRDSLEGKTLSMDEIVGIGQAIEQAIATRKQAIIQTFRDHLNPLAIAQVENDTFIESMIYNAAYLIPWDNEPEFGTLVETLDRQFDGRLKISYNNFTAPYNFAQLESLN